MLEDIMKIESQIPKLPVQDKTVQKGKEKEATHVEKKKTTEVARTKTPRFSVDKIRARIDAEPDVDIEKVKALREKIRKGEYRVDSEKLAANLVKNSLVEDI
jgi:flagellar biosynthesis anti-sigma factor FlgM